MKEVRSRTLKETNRIKGENKERVKDIIEMRKAQKEALKLLIVPVDENIRLAKEVLQGKISYKQFIAHSKIVNKFLLKLEGKR